MPDRIEIEPGALAEEVVQALRLKGHRIRQLEDSYGNMQAIAWDRRSGEVTAASDPRGIGSSVLNPPSSSDSRP